MINISFFSYKGGAGRTSLLYNTLPFLAEKLNATETEPIIVIDLDIDSKGLSYLISRNSEINAIQVLRGEDVIGTRCNAPIHEHPFFKGLCPIGAAVGLPADKDRAILFISANSNGFLGDQNNFNGSGISLNALNRLCNAYNCKAIVMDTPAGSQLSANCALSISNKIVTVMRITRQFRKGTGEFLREKTGKYAGKEFIITPNAVPDAKGTAFDINLIMQDITNIAVNSVSEDNTVNLTLLKDGRQGINEVNLFKFSEENLKLNSISRTLTADEEQAVAMYKVLAEELSNGNA